MTPESWQPWSEHESETIQDVLRDEAEVSTVLDAIMLGWVC